MLINTSLTSDTAARNLQGARGAHTFTTPSGASPETVEAGPAANRYLQTGPLAEDAASAIHDSDAADTVTGLFRSNLFSQYEPALAAQGNLNPASVCNLLQL
jgi:hypothetical protein